MGVRLTAAAECDPEPGLEDGHGTEDSMDTSVPTRHVPHLVAVTGDCKTLPSAGSCLQSMLHLVKRPPPGGGNCSDHAQC